MKSISMLSIALVTGISLSACSSSTADDSPINYELNHKHTQHEDPYHTHENGQYVEGDFQVVNFMNENFDMSKIEKRSCCDE